jgi:hypothetical protein
MSEHYSHLLIPDRPDFVPLPAQVIAFLEGLTELGSAPLKATVKIAKLSGKVRTARNAFTGETINIPAREFVPLRDLDAIKDSLDGLSDYILLFSGQGPAERPPFKLYLPSDRKWQSEIRAEHFYEVNFNLRESRVSLNDWMAPHTSDCGEGVFRNPWNNDTIRVPKAACASFWIEFMFGNWLVPKIEKSLELLPSSILNLASESFGASFVQGGRFD